METLDDLNNANDVMAQLLNIDWYRGLIQGKQMVMIGYSDSAKDAGVMAASWAQYQAQDALIKTCEKAGIELTLFHGRGGSIGRGARTYAHAALLSQPPGSLKGGLRVTEQGEMIPLNMVCQKSPSTACRCTPGRFWANLLPPPEPKESWRRIMDELSVISCDLYRGYVRENKILCLTSAPLRRNRNWANCRWVHVRRNVAQPAASSRCAPFRGFLHGRKTA